MRSLGRIGSFLFARMVGAIGGLLRATVPGGFRIATTAVPLSEVERAWLEDDSTRRTVFTMPG